MRIELRYGATLVEANIDWIVSADTLALADVPSIADAVVALDTAIDNPIGQSESLSDRVQPGERITIVVSDSFRKTGVDRLLPRLLLRVNERGVRDDDIRILVATGVHRGPTPDELSEILGVDVRRRFGNRQPRGGVDRRLPNQRLHGHAANIEEQRRQSGIRPRSGNDPLTRP